MKKKKLELESEYDLNVVSLDLPQEKKGRATERFSLITINQPLIPRD